MTDPTVERMAKFLRDLNVDLGDEREVFRTLRQLHFLEGDIVALSDQAVELARGDGLKLSAVIGDGAAVVFAAGAWLAWYVVLCPAVS